MEKAQLDFIPKFEQSDRIKILEARNQELGTNGMRQYGAYGDHRCWLNVGPFPKLDQLPSAVEGYRADGESWGKDFAFMLDNTEPHIYPCETIVGEIYWEIGLLRECSWKQAKNAEEIQEKYDRASELGGNEGAYGHTCPDLAIGLEQGFDKILERIRKSRAMYERLENKRKAVYLAGLEHICMACSRYIERYAALAEKLRDGTEDPDEKTRFDKIARCCASIAHKAPADYYEAVQFIQFAILFDRSVGHGNGYGRLDLYLIEFYKRGMAEGSLTRKEAREYVSEMYMKLRGQFFSVGGRDANLQDATNEMSWVVIEAYDLIGDYNNLGVMWHPDIDPEFYSYCCDVLARHGESIPVLVNYDIMYDSELRSGIPHEDAWKVVYSGCQWYCIPGMEWCGQDTNHINLLKPFERALKRAAGDEVPRFEALYAYYEEEIAVTMKAFQEVEAMIDRVRGDTKPEMFTSLLSHGPIERGLDMVAPRGVDYQYSSLNIFGIPNIADSLFAIQKLVFEEKVYTLRQLVDACDAEWSGNEIMRQRFLNQDKYGNGLEEVDAMFKRVCDTTEDIAGAMINQRGGQEYRPSLFSFMSHLEKKDQVGATPDGRHGGDLLAHGINPTAGMNKRGLIPTANSFVSVNLRKFQGGSLQVELQPRFFDGKENRGDYIRNFSTAFFQSGGVQINLHILDLKKLEDAILHPEKPEYRSLVVRVTGYCARFITLSLDYQREFVSRVNYSSLQ